MPWPAGNVPVANVDEGTDSAALARVDLKTLIDQFNAAIASRGGADGVCELDASGKIPFSRQSGVVVGTYTTAVLASPGQDERSVAHGLGTDDIDIGISLFGSNIIPGAQSVSGTAMGADKRFVTVGGSVIYLSPPAPGNVAIAVRNDGGDQTITVNWWARKRT